MSTLVGQEELMFLVQLGGRSRYIRLEVTRNGYAQGTNTRVDVFDTEGPYGRLSVNVPEQLADPDTFWLKDWSENAELARTLVGSGRIVIVPEIAPIASGFVQIKAARLG